MKMPKLFLLLMIVGIQPAFADTSGPSSQDTFSDHWVTYYYLHKNAAQTGDFIQWLQNSQTLEKNEGAAQPFAAFLSMIFKENPSQISRWVKSVDLTGKTKKTVEAALWLSGKEGLILELFNEDTNYTKSPAPPLIDLSPKNPSDLDMLWGAFIATGDDEYVKKILNVLDNNFPLAGDKLSDKLTRRAAEWSLGSNMMQHELVNRLVRKEMGSRSGEVRQKLKEMIARADEAIIKGSAHDRDGDFSAMLVITDENELKEYEKPPSEEMTVRRSAKARRGDIVAIKLLFSGMELSEDLSADVTYDLKVLDPDGKTYDDGDYKGLVALKRKTGSRFMWFDNISFEKIRFEQKDKLGKYKVIAVLYDNVGKKKIPLTDEIELVE